MRANVFLGFGFSRCCPGVHLYCVGVVCGMTACAGIVVDALRGWGSFSRWLFPLRLVLSSWMLRINFEAYFVPNLNVGNWCRVTILPLTYAWHEIGSVRNNERIFLFSHLSGYTLKKGLGISSLHGIASFELGTITFWQSYTPLAALSMYLPLE